MMSPSLKSRSPLDPSEKMRKLNPEHRIAVEEALMEKMSAKSVANFKSVFDKIENMNANNTKPSTPRGSTFKSLSRSVSQMLLGKKTGEKKSRKPVVKRGGKNRTHKKK